MAVRILGAVAHRVSSVSHGHGLTHAGLPLQVMRATFAETRWGSLATVADAVSPLVRCFSGSSAKPPSEGTPADKAVVFMVSLHYEEKLARAIVKSLEHSGTTGEELLSVIRTLAGRWEVGVDNGLADLAMVVRAQMARTEGKKMVKFWCVPSGVWSRRVAAVPEGADVEDRRAMREEIIQKGAFEVEALEGMSLGDVAMHGDGKGSDILSEYIECSCSGIMACSTCHVVIDKDFYKRVGEPDEDELDMIDLAYEPTPTSRLGCQVMLSSELEGMVIYLPRGHNNIMDDIPF